MKNWFKRQLTAIAIATSKVEQSAINQIENDTNGIGMVQDINQGTLMKALINGEVTEEVENLRWKSMKILETLSNNNNDVESLKEIDLTFEENEFPIFMSHNNYNNDVGLIDINDIDKKGENTFNIERDYLSKFKFENFIDKFHIRKNSDDDVLVEFYCSLNSEENNRVKRLFLKEIEKCLERNKFSDLFDIKTFEFITHNTIGYKDMCHFKYSDLIFNKIVLHSEYSKDNKYYIIKYNCKTKINGDYILEKYRSSELDEKYENKLKK